MTDHEDDAYLSDPHRVRTLHDIKYLFQLIPAERHRVTCDYCGSLARRNHEKASRWFLDHVCVDADGRATTGRKQLPTLSAGEERSFLTEEANKAFWARASRFEIFPQADGRLEERLERWISRAAEILDDERRQRSERANGATARPAFDELTARRTMKEEQVEEQYACDAERLAKIAQELFGIATRLQARFPSSHILSATVDRFIQAALESDTLLRRAA